MVRVSGENNTRIENMGERVRKGGNGQRTEIIQIKLRVLKCELLDSILEISVRLEDKKALRSS